MTQADAGIILVAIPIYLAVVALIISVTDPVSPFRQVAVIAGIAVAGVTLIVVTAMLVWLFTAREDPPVEAATSLVATATATTPSSAHPTVPELPTTTIVPGARTRPTPTVVPTSPPTRPPTLTPSPTVTPTRLPGVASIPLGAWLPSRSDVPVQLIVTSDRSRTLDEVAANYSDPVGMTTLFRSWGWQGNVIRAFAPPGGAPLSDPNLVGGVYVSVSSFDSAASAAEALDYSLIVQAEGASLIEIGPPPFAYYGRTLYGEVDYLGDGFLQYEITYLVQVDNVLLRLTVASPDGDPFPVAYDVMAAMLAVAP